MITQATVKLNGHIMGSLAMNSISNAVRFTFDPTFTATGLQPSPIMMPVVTGSSYSFTGLNEETFHGLPGLFIDSLPDTYGSALFDKWLALTGSKCDNIIERLCYQSNYGMGALEYEPTFNVDEHPFDNINIDSLVNVANAALSSNDHTISSELSSSNTNHISHLLRLGTFAGGQRAKAIIGYNVSTNEVCWPLRELPKDFENYIMKLDGIYATAGSKPTCNFGKVEYSFSKLVKECGIDMTDCHLLDENGLFHFLTKRFDRDGNRKVHMQTLCGFAHYDYRHLRRYSYEQAFQVMRKLGQSHAEMEEMFRRIVFNVVVMNQDDHTKNISFLMDEGGKWRLSPAYDMMYSYNPKGEWTSQHQMSINGKYDNITRCDLIELGQRENIPNSDKIIDKVCEKATLWPSIAKDCDVPQVMIDEMFPNFQLIH